GVQTCALPIVPRGAAARQTRDRPRTSASRDNARDHGQPGQHHLCGAVRGRPDPRRTTATLPDRTPVGSSACAQVDEQLSSPRRCRIWGGGIGGGYGRIDRAARPLAAAWSSGAKWLTLIDPFASVPGHLRTGLRNRFAELVAHDGRGVVFSSNSLTDHTIAEAGVADIEKDQLVALGSLEQVVSEPRGSLPAELSGVNVYSGLARKGWLSIGHSAVRARTELDGKVFVTLGWRAARLSLDEHDPAFTSATVFEAIVTGLRDRGSCLQAKLSPVDTEMGLALDVD